MRFIAFTLTGLVAVKLAAAQIAQLPPETRRFPALNSPPSATCLAATRG